MSRRKELGRRAFLGGVAALGGAAILSRVGPGRAFATGLSPPAAPRVGRTVTLHLVAAERAVKLPCLAGRELPLWTFSESDWLPVIRIDLGDRLLVRLSNRLPRPGEHTSIHWHGIRLPNDQDGVPYLTQEPVEPGEDCSYSFTPPDTGTFFFHTHCNTAEQLGRGLAGLLIVDGDAVEPYDSDEAIVLRDWRLTENKAGFLPFYTEEGAVRAGTFGTVRTANGAVVPEIPLPASGDCRLRVLNIDPARVVEMGIRGADAALAAIDGVAIPPVPLRSWRMGPAMRADVVIRAPRENETAMLVDYFAPEPVPLARLVGRGAARRTGAFDPAPLRAGRMPDPDLKDAERLTFEFTPTATGQAVARAADSGAALGALCLANDSFWAINRAAWPGHGAGRIPPPLAVLQRDRSYIFELVNRTKQQHPIHIHGHHLKLLKSNKRDLPVHRADTLLLYPDERIETAFVADNPGNWMFHCHIVEHQESGMMGYVRVL
jgi:FtsP/CotA-like multicopper oxidase with cupredoxin domain